MNHLEDPDTTQYFFRHRDGTVEPLRNPATHPVEPTSSARSLSPYTKRFALPANGSTPALELRVILQPALQLVTLVLERASASRPITVVTVAL